MNCLFWEIEAKIPSDFSGEFPCPASLRTCAPASLAYATGLCDTRGRVTRKAKP